MKKVYNLNNIVKLFILVLFGVVTSCSVNSVEKDEPPRGSLSEAIEKSSDDYEGQRKINARDVRTDYDSASLKRQEPIERINYNSEKDNLNDVEYDSEMLTNSNNFQKDIQPIFDTEVNLDVDSYVHKRDSLKVAKIKNDEISQEEDIKEDMRDYTFFKLNVNSGPLHTKEFYGYQQFGIGFSEFITDNQSLQLDFSVGHSNIQETAELSKSLTNGVTFFDLDFTFKRLSSNNLTFAAPFCSAGFGFSVMLWKYKNPIELIENNDSELITGDSVGGYNIFVGAGLKIFQPNPFNLSVQVNPGVKIWSNKTTRGFENDYFDLMPYLKLTLELEFKTDI